MQRMIADLPRLAIGLVVGQMFTKDRAKAAAAPDHGTKEGNKLQRRKHGAASISSSLARRPADGLRVAADHLVHGAVHAHRAMVHPDATGAELRETDQIMTDHDDKPGPIHHLAHALLRFLPESHVADAQYLIDQQDFRLDGGSDGKR